MIAPQFTEAGLFHEGMAYVAIDDQRTGNTLYGYINKAGKQVIPCQFEDARDFSCGRAAVKKNGKWLYIDQHGQMALDNSFVWVDSLFERAANGSTKVSSTEVNPKEFKNGLLLVAKGNAKYGYVDTTGKTVIPFIYNVAYNFSEGIAIVSNEAIKPKLEAGYDSLSKFYNNLPDGSPQLIYKAIDVSGKLLFTMEKDMKGVKAFSNGMAIFYNDGEKSQSSLFGFINKAGTIIFPAKFQTQPAEFGGGISFVQIDGTQEQNKDALIYTLDTLGNVIAKIPVCDLSGQCMYDSNHLFSEGLMSVKVGQKWGYMDKMGKMVVEPQFDTATDFSEGLAVVVLESGKLAVIRNPLKIESK
jgi:hypothetical protein